MPVDGEPEVGVQPRVDDAHPVALPGLEVPLDPRPVAEAGRVAGARAVKGVLAVDGGAGERRRAGGEARVPPRGERGDVRSVLQDDGAEVFVVVGRRGAVDDHGSLQADRVLQAVVGVVPRGAVLLGDPPVGEALPGRLSCLVASAGCPRARDACRGVERVSYNRALCDAGHAVIYVVVELPDAVEVNGGPVVLQQVGDVHDDFIAAVGLDGRARDGAVYGHYILQVTLMW